MANSKAQTGYKRLFELGPDRLAQIDSMLLKGTPEATIAHTIQDKWKQFTDLKFNTLERQIRRYRERTLKVQVALIAPTSEQGQAEQRIVLHKLSKTLDPIVELQELAELQKSRIKKLMDREVQLPFLTRNAHVEIGLLRDILKEMGKLMIDVGVLRKMIGQESQQRSFSVSEVYEGQVHISEAVKKATEEALQIIHGEVVDVSYDNDKQEDASDTPQSSTA